MDHLAKLQGPWTIISMEIDGHPLMHEAFTGALVTVEGDRFTTESMGAEYTGELTLNASTKPHSFDLHFLSGPEAGNTSLGIYQLKGDLWRICLTTFGSVRPNAFATVAGSGLALETLRRGRAEPSEDRQRLPGEAIPELDGVWKMKSCIRDGYPLDPTMLKSGRRFSGDGETTVQFGKQVFLQANFRVDSTSRPATIDYFNIRGQSPDKIQYGIYELVGGALRICYGLISAKRPIEFRSDPGSELTLTEWVRS